MNRQVATWGLALLVLGAIPELLQGTHAFNAAERMPGGGAEVQAHTQAYMGLVYRGGSVESNETLTVAWIWNNGTTPLTFGVAVVEDPNQVVTRMNVDPAGEVPVGGRAWVNVTAHGQPRQTHRVVFEITGNDPGVMHAHVRNLEIDICILVGGGGGC